MYIQNLLQQPATYIYIYIYIYILRFNECPQQCIGITAALSFKNLVATPDFLPSMVAALS